ncbi:hypothetical protein Nepgr_002114 [Nepenthes gracilis]|uniref:O-fucosyltransferase family protein n=1 Tax=Nepenthes gracilis TaxID=150966 RepID=A0AAD3RY96_NEPGR|nr:hypothetical protein Nepgr_002114 [Nepenthes gracilis]
MEPAKTHFDPASIATTVGYSNSDSSSQVPPRNHFILRQFRRPHGPTPDMKCPFPVISLRYWLLLHLLYVLGLIMRARTLSPVVYPSPVPGSVYRSHELFLKLWNDIQSDNSTPVEICNAVAVAGLLNVTLVIPHFGYHNVWRDPR